MSTPRHRWSTDPNRPNDRLSEQCEWCKTRRILKRANDPLQQAVYFEADGTSLDSKPECIDKSEARATRRQENRSTERPRYVKPNSSLSFNTDPQFNPKPYKPMLAEEPPPKVLSLTRLEADHKDALMMLQLVYQDIQTNNGIVNHRVKGIINRFLQSKGYEEWVKYYDEKCTA